MSHVLGKVAYKPVGLLLGAAAGVRRATGYWPD